MLIGYQITFGGGALPQPGCYTWNLKGWKEIRLTYLV
jgi:hypothetical protein